MYGRCYGDDLLYAILALNKYFPELNNIVASGVSIGI